MKSAFNLPSVIVGLLLSVVIAMYSSYVGLKVGGVSWPIIPATLMSIAALKLFGGGDPRQVNVAATAASTGGLLAGGIIFTIPALWLLGLDVSILDVTFVALAGGLLGVLFTAPLREEMIERLELPYPDGTATARVIEAGDAGGAKIRVVLAFFGLGALFTLARDLFRLLPPVVNLDRAGAAAARWFSFGTNVTLVSLASGYLIGPRFTGTWFFGGAVSYLLVVPWLVASGRFADKGAALTEITKPFGIGVIIGASFGFFFLKGLPSFLPMARRLLVGDGQAARRAPRGPWLIALAALIVAISAGVGLPVWVTIVAVAGAFLVSYMAARIAGELNIDPMEIFAIAILLIVLLFVRLEPRTAVVFAALLCISAGMAGDFMQDLKAGALVGTVPTDQLKAQVVSVVFTSLALGVILTALHSTYGIGTLDLPAPQAVALSSLVEAGGVTGPLAWGGAVGLALIAASLAVGWGILPVAFGIGLYAPIELSTPLFAGGLARLWVERRAGDGGRRESAVDRGRLVAAGVIGGEGFTGVVIALAGMFGLR